MKVELTKTEISILLEWKNCRDHYDTPSEYCEMIAVEDNLAKKLAKKLENTIKNSSDV